MQNGKSYYLFVSQIIFQTIKEPGRIRKDCLNVNLQVPKEKEGFSITPLSHVWLTWLVWFIYLPSGHVPGTGQGKSKDPTAKVSKRFIYYLLPNKLYLYTMPILKPYVCLFTKFCPVLSKQHHEFSDMQVAISDV